MHGSEMTDEQKDWYAGKRTVKLRKKILKKPFDAYDLFVELLDELEDREIMTEDERIEYERQYVDKLNETFAKAGRVQDMIGR